MVMVGGTPKDETHPWANASATDSAVASCNGMACGQRESRSTIVRRYLYPLERGRETRSRLTCSNLFCGTRNSPIGGTTCLVTFDLWQGKHSRAHLEVSWRTLGQMKRLQTDWRVLSTPGCPNPCMASNTLLLHEYGTSGRGFPVDMSTSSLESPMSTDLMRRFNC